MKKYFLQRLLISDLEDLQLFGAITICYIFATIVVGVFFFAFSLVSFPESMLSSLQDLERTVLFFMTTLWSVYIFVLTVNGVLGTIKLFKYIKKEIENLF